MVNFNNTGIPILIMISIIIVILIAVRYTDSEGTLKYIRWFSIETGRLLWESLYYKWYILYVIIIIIGVNLSYKYVNPIFNKKFKANREFIKPDGTEAETPEVATLYYFYTIWCPICKVAEQEYNAFKKSTNGMVKNVVIVFKEIDCDKESQLADQFDVKGYPTIKLVYKDKTYEYDAKPNKDTLYQFLNEIL